MSSVVATIDSVTAKETNSGKTVYTVTADGKKYTTFKKDIAAAAKELIGKQAEIDVTSQEKGEFTNHYINAAKPVAPKGDVFPVTPDDRQASIQRQCALKSAVEFCKTDEKATVEGVLLAAEAFNAWLAGTKPVVAGPAGDNFDDIPFAPTV